MQQKPEDEGGVECQKVECSVAFIDICAFTAISERREPEVVIDLLNHYFEAIVEAVQPLGGAIDKFIGDAAMVTFTGDEHRVRATRACLAARDAISGVRGELADRIGFRPNVAIGLNAGTAVMGPVGAKSLGRLDFTIIGDMVNTAARLQTVACAEEVVVTADFAQALNGQFAIADRGVRSLKGKAEPVHLFAITGHSTTAGEAEL